MDTGTAVEAADVPAVAGVPASASALPETSTLLGSSPLAAARLATLTPARAAIAESVSPGWTT